MKFIQTAKKALVSIVATAILIFACDNNPTEPNNQKINITGLVVDNNVSPIRDVSIHFIYNNLYDFFTKQNTKTDLSKTNSANEVISFSGNYDESGVLLQWSSKNETNTVGYYIHRQHNGSGWVQVGSIIESKNASDNKEDYEYRDMNIENGQYLYKLEELIDDGSTISHGPIEIIISITPSSTLLYQNYPNPFNPSTVIHFSLATASAVSLIIYDWPENNEIRTLVDRNCNAGKYAVLWDGRNASDEIMPNGIYPYKIITSDFNDEKIMCIQHMSTGVLEGSKSNFKTNSEGEFEINYPSIPIGKTIHQTSEMGPEIINSYTITDSIYIVLTKPDYTAIIEKINIDTTKSLNLNFTLNPEEP